MVYIKKLVLKGFKSFPKETEISFVNSMNVIVGPNGSGKSNITDAICFVLGRMSIKSLRAAKSANLIFAGTKQHRPAMEASVKLILDNTDKKFSLEEKEIIIERIVRSSGQSIYKINNKTKTRQEVLELLGQAGIDPYGFNIVLQGEINNIIRMSGEERRKVIEEVAGISVYEVRKEKSLRELEKTEEKLKQVGVTLRERATYLRNLEEERKQALKYKKLKEDIERYKASIIKRRLKEKEKELSNFTKQLEDKEKKKEDEKGNEARITKKIHELEGEIEKINSQIQTSSGKEQDELNREISDLRAELAGLDVRKENNENRLEELLSRKDKIKSNLETLKQDIEKLRKEFPTQAKKQKELEEKKEQLEQIEKERETYYTIKEKLNTVKEKLKDKQQQLQKNKNNIFFLIKESDKISQHLSFFQKENCKEEIQKLKKQKEEAETDFEKLQKQAKQEENLIFSYKTEISNLEKIKTQVSKLDICPLCKSKITKEHIKQVFRESNEKISDFEQKIQTKQKSLKQIEKEIQQTKSQLTSLQSNILKAETDLIKLENIEDKKQQIKTLSEEQEDLQKEIKLLEKEKGTLQKKILQYNDVEERYDTIILDIQEISSRTKENINTELQFKEKNFENFKLTLKQLNRQEQDLKQEIEEINGEITEKQQQLSEKEEENRRLEAKFQKLIEKRRLFEKEIHKNNSSLLESQNRISLIDEKINNLKIEIARLKAEQENLGIDFEPYKNIKIFNLPPYILEERLNKTQTALDNIGNVNLKALEVYDSIKKQYDVIADKASVLEKEKQEILKIIEEIDKKKKRTFLRTLKAINELFNRNFIQLSTKGQVFLELENKEDIFSGGLDIVIKIGKGKYFDVTSLSGGEQTLVALSLIFAIQEYKPYCFYIFDEVDAALDKRNSERLAALIKKYMKTGQYIIITHNDAIITESTVLYGISMQEGISKIVSLEV